MKKPKLVAGHSQKTSIVNLKRSDLGVDFGLSWSFGK